MKKFLITAILLPLALVSCKKDCDCDKSKDTRIETTITERETASDTVNATASPVTETAATARRTTAGTRTKTTRAKSQDYLSNPAPDGTDAENHDNDYYTRNDTSRKPTGTSIK